MHIKVKLKGSSVTIDPMVFSVKHGNHPIKWKMKDDSDQFDFDNPPVTFDNANAPMSTPTPHGSSADSNDSNQNSSANGVDYTYHVHLIDPSGGKITYPPLHDPCDTADPAIRNEPK